jgi:hypothetical protein
MSHYIRPVLWGGVVSADWTCTAEAGAECRKHCPEGCPTWPCDHELVDSGACMAIDWLENEDWRDLYDGPETTVRNAEVTLRWDGEGYVWHYADLRDAVTTVDGSVTGGSPAPSEHYEKDGAT